jgi:hypothetical protein
MNKKNVQSFERRGNLGLFYFGEDESDEATHELVVKFYGQPTIRSRQECIREQQQMLRLDAYEEEEMDGVVFH